MPSGAIFSMSAKAESIVAILSVLINIVQPSLSEAKPWGAGTGASRIRSQCSNDSVTALIDYRTVSRAQGRRLYC
ncbi:hypothetical protein V1524DRAFT_444241 [Lipomyces starkeyi]